MMKGLENLSYEEKLKELSLFSLEKIQGGPHHSFPALKGLLQRRWSLMPLMEAHGKHKGQKVQVVRGEASSQYKKYFFFSVNHHWNNLLRDVVESPLWKVFKMQLHMVTDNVIQTLPLRVGSDDLSRSLPVFCDRCSSLNKPWFLSLSPHKASDSDSKQLGGPLLNLFQHRFTVFSVLGSLKLGQFPNGIS